MKSGSLDAGQSGAARGLKANDRRGTPRFGARVGLLLLVGTSVGIGGAARAAEPSKPPASFREPVASTVASSPGASVQAKGKSVWDKLPKMKNGEIKLLEAGAEPRQQLRYKYPVGAGGVVRLTTRSELEVETDGKKQKAGFVPKLEMLAKLKVKEKQSDGDFLVDLIGLRPRVRNASQLPAPIQKQLETALGKLPKLHGISEVNDRGVQKALKFDAAKVDSVEMNQILQGLQANLGGMSAPLPAEAVGVGAKWAVNTSVVQQGLPLTQIAIYELVSLKDGVGRTRVEMRQIAPKGEIKLPGAPPGAKTELVKMTSKGEGESYFDLENPVPKGRMKTSTKISLKTTMGKRSQSVTLRIKALLRFRPKTK
ncbi:MAG: hypothetical protein R3B89_23120 [Polyangiaceae bacterium]